MDDERSRGPNPGSLLAALGFLIFGAVLAAGFFGRRIPFFSENLFLPILMIFVGRAIARRSRSRADREPSPTMAPPHRTPTAPPPTRRPAPPRPSEATVPRSKTETEEAPASPRPTTSRPAKQPDEELPPVVASRPLRKAGTPKSGYQPKTSEEMIAEAKERLSRGRG